MLRDWMIRKKSISRLEYYKDIHRTLGSEWIRISLIRSSLQKDKTRIIATLLKTMCILMLLASPTLSRADDDAPDQVNMSIEELMGIKVYGASKFEQKASEAPAAVSIVTADEIRKYGYRTLADILRSMRGFYVTYDRNYSYMGLRGFGSTGNYNSRFLILIDGHRINDNIYDSVLVGTDFILDVDIISRVEVIRGPAFSLYGSNAFIGVINIISKSGEDFRGGEISGEAGSFRSYKGRMSAGGLFRNGLELVVSGSLYDSDGRKRLYFREFDDQATNNGVTENTDHDRNYSLFAKASLGDFSLDGAYVSRTKGIPTASYETDFNEPRNRTVDTQGFLDLKYQHDFGRESELIARLSYDVYRSKGDYLYSGVVNNDSCLGERWTGEVHLTGRPHERHRLLVGAEYQYNSRQQQKNYDEDPFTLYLDDRRSSKRWAVYLEDEIRITDTLIANLGVRYERTYTSKKTINPRVAVIYNPSDNTALKFLYGEAFRPANLYELYYQDNVSFKPNPDLEPERIRTYELVYEQRLSDAISMTAAGFYYKIKDLINQVINPADGLMVFVNHGEVKATGLELEVEGKWGNGLQGRISYAYTNAEDGLTGGLPVNSPYHLATLNIIVPVVRDRVFLGAETQYTSSVKTPRGRKTDGFSLTNLTLFSQKLVKGMELSASVYNLFNKKYSLPGGPEHVMDTIEQDGRTYRVKLTYRF